MKRLAEMILVGMLTLLSVPAGAQESAGELLSRCRGIPGARVVYGPGEPTIDLPDDRSTGICWGYFTAISQAVFTVYRDDVAWLWGGMVCVPDGVTTKQLVDVFVEYANSNPQKHHERALFVVETAMRHAWSCQPKSATAPAKPKP